MNKNSAFACRRTFKQTLLRNYLDVSSRDRRPLWPSVLALAQLSRTIEQRADKMPMASDLRSSGQIEQDADLILGLLRPAVYDEAEPPEDMLLGVIKHREGVPGAVIRLNWHGPTTSVSDPTRGSP